MSRALAQGLHRIYNRTNQALQNVESLESLESLESRGSLERCSLPVERKRLEKNAKQAMNYWLGKKYHRPRTKRFVEKIKRGYPLLL